VEREAAAASTLTVVQRGMVLGVMTLNSMCMSVFYASREHTIVSFLPVVSSMPSKEVDPVIGLGP
jgi:hypothetical protein